jgi:hypothetical protein
MKPALTARVRSALFERGVAFLMRFAKAVRGFFWKGQPSMQRLYVTILVSLCSAGSAMADVLCLANKDTALYVGADLSEEIRPVFQFDGVQFVPSDVQDTVIGGNAFSNLMEPLLETPSFVRAADWDCEGFSDTASQTTSAQASSVAIYDVTLDACNAEISDTRVTVSESTYGFYESSCDIVEQTSDAAGGMLVQMQCYGSGDEWQMQMRAVLSDAALTLDVDGAVQRYVACTGAQ